MARGPPVFAGKPAPTEDASALGFLAKAHVHLLSRPATETAQAPTEHGLRDWRQWIHGSFDNRTGLAIFMHHVLTLL
jgi:hypothetical protein